MSTAVFGKNQFRRNFERNLLKSKYLCLTVLICLWVIHLFSGISLAEITDHKSLPIPTGMVQVPSKKYDSACIVTVESVLQIWKNKGDQLLVDVRNKPAFERFRIPGSINIPLHAIKTKTFLKSRPLVLINDGYRHSQLETACLTLRAAGFSDVRVMFGGLHYWGEKGGTIEGDVFSQKKINKVSAGAFFEERHFENQIVVNISENMPAEALAWIPETLHVPYRAQEKTFITALQEALRNRAGDPLKSILVYNQWGDYSADLPGLLKKAGIKNVYYLESGLKGYQAFLQNQIRMLQSGSERQTIKKCASCP